MHNQSLPIRAKIVKKTLENPLVNTLRLKFPFLKQRNFQFLAGQFIMAGVPGFGEAAFTLSSDPRVSRDYFEITVRSVGELTRKINSLSPGEPLFIRGPFGNGFPEVKNDLILIGGGCGFIPLKAVLIENLNRPGIKIKTFFGCKNRQTLTFERNYAAWKDQHDLNIILEEEPLPGFNDKTGFVTSLIEASDLSPAAQVFACGPEGMYQAVVDILLKKGLAAENIFLSLERRMDCGQGICQHCAIGPKYVCHDGPVFSYAFLKTLPEFSVSI